MIAGINVFLRLMGQDEVYLQVIAASGEKSEKKTAAKVLKLLKRGKHWVLVTLLVGNVITNETLPIVLDRSIGGGYAAAISSTVLVSKYIPMPVWLRGLIQSCSYLWRNRPSIHMCTLWSSNWCSVFLVCSSSHVGHGAYHLADCQTFGLSSRRGPWYYIQESWSQNTSYTTQNNGRCQW